MSNELNQWRFLATTRPLTSGFTGNRLNFKPTLDNFQTFFDSSCAVEYPNVPLSLFIFQADNYPVVVVSNNDNQPQQNQTLTLFYMLNVHKPENGPTIAPTVSRFPHSVPQDHPYLDSYYLQRIPPSISSEFLSNVRFGVQSSSIHMRLTGYYMNFMGHRPRLPVEIYYRWVGTQLHFRLLQPSHQPDEGSPSQVNEDA